MKYHAATFALLNKSPKQNPRAEAAIARAEKRLGYRLPRSLRAWYSLANAESILKKFARADTVISLREFGVRDKEEDEWDEEERAADKGYLIIRIENQGVCEWGVKLNGSDDPPVACRVDDERWQTATKTFSEYVYTCVWDGRTENGRWTAIAQQSGRVRKASLAALGKRFTPGPVTDGWPPGRQYRFEQGDQKILIWADTDGSDFLVKAHSRASLIDLLKAVRELGGEMLFESHTPEIEELLQASQG